MYEDKGLGAPLIKAGGVKKAFSYSGAPKESTTKNTGTGSAFGARPIGGVGRSMRQGTENRINLTNQILSQEGTYTYKPKKFVLPMLQYPRKTKIGGK